MLVRAGDRGIYRYRPVHHPGGIRRSDDLRQHPIPDALRRHPMVPGPDRLPGPEHRREIPPRDPRSIPVHDAFDHEPRIRERPTLTPRRTRQHPLNQRPLSIRELLKPRHVSSVSARTLNLSGTHRGGRERRLPFWRTC